jgi:hypothetical protein
MPTTPSTPQHIDSYSIISISGHRLTSSSGKWGLETLDKLLEAGGELARLDNVVQPLEPKEGDAMASSKAPTSAPVPPEQPDRKERNWTTTVSTPEKAEQS